MSVARRAFLRGLVAIGAAIAGFLGGWGARGPSKPPEAIAVPLVRRPFPPIDDVVWAEPRMASGSPQAITVITADGTRVIIAPDGRKWTTRRMNPSDELEIDLEVVPYKGEL